MKRKVVGSVAAVALAASLGTFSPANAILPCTDCVIEGVAELSRWIDPDLKLQGTFAGVVVNPGGVTSAGIGTITIETGWQDWPAGGAGVHRGDGVATITVHASVPTSVSYQVSFAVTAIGTDNALTVAGAKTQEPYTYAFSSSLVGAQGVLYAGGVSAAS